MRLSTDLSSESREARRQWDDTFVMLKEKNLSTEICIFRKTVIQKLWYTQIKKKKLRELVTTRPGLQEIVKEDIHGEMKER